MERLQNVTLQYVRDIVKEKGYAFWRVNGNYMNIEALVNGEEVKTNVFLGNSFCVLELSIEKRDHEEMASRSVFVDMWPDLLEKYPNIFQEGVKGEALLFP